MATVNSGTYSPVGIANARSTETVIWILVATVLFMLLFLLGEGSDFKEGSTITSSTSNRVNHGANAQSSISERPNGADYRSRSY